MASRSREIRELTIKNIGVIEEASVSFGPGFNVITGETGAGKTMVLTGLSLLAGGRADLDLIRTGKERLSVSTTVALGAPATGRLNAIIEEHQPEFEQEELILQRVVSREGKGKAIVGSDPVTVALLGEFATEFFTIHGQSTNHKLAEKRHQLALLDQASDQIQTQKVIFQEALETWRARARELEELRKALSDRDRQIGILKSFLDDHSRTQPKQDEWQEITERINRLDSVVEFTSALSSALAALDGEDDGVVTRMAIAAKALESLKADDRAIRDLGDRLRESLIEVRDISSELSSLLDGFESDPQELDRLRARKSSLKQYIGKYRDLVESVDDDNEVLNQILDHVPQRKALLEDLENGDTRIDDISSECDSLRALALEEAIRVRDHRVEAAKRLSSFVNGELGNLGLKGARFDIRFIEIPFEKVTHEGVDEVEFVFAAHSSGTLLPLGKGISGGELSRVMLAVELALKGEDQSGCLIFDEIDSGIGGETGLLIGERLSRLAERNQIVVITHLAQVAVWADRHFRIEKDEGGDYVLSSVKEVKGEERIEEIARMLSGQSNLQAARDHAKELLKHAGK